MSTHPTRDFVKMHGLGNDFVIFDGRRDGFRPDPALAARVADRHFGVGCDQVITLEPSANADLFMRIQNPDGSESGACGNATRCVARLVLDETGGDRMVIETLGGLLACTRLPDGRITVDMGAPRLDWQDIPLARAMDTGDLEFATHDSRDHQLVAPVAVSMGNPHAVFFVADAEAIDLPEVGPRIEHDPLFPARVNVSVASIMDRAGDSPKFRVRVWERGAGITLACGSASCAVAVAATRRGLAEGRATVVMDGGALELEWRESDGHVLMTGPTALVFAGSFPLGSAA